MAQDVDDADPSRAEDDVGCRGHQRIGGDDGQIEIGVGDGAAPVLGPEAGEGEMGRGPGPTADVRRRLVEREVLESAERVDGNEGLERPRGGNDRDGSRDVGPEACPSGRVDLAAGGRIRGGGVGQIGHGVVPSLAIAMP